MSSLPALLLAFVLAAPLCGLTGGGSPVRLRVESGAQAAGAPSVLVIEGLRGLPQSGAVVEVRAHARGVAPDHALLTQFNVLSARTKSWRIVVDAPTAVLAAVTADRNATVSITACRHGEQNRCIELGAHSVTLLRNTNA
jgi:hypothetical protein